MRAQKLQMAGLPGLISSNAEKSEHGGALLYGGVALGVVAGAALSAYWWQRTRALDLLNTSPLERAEELISNCESKLEDIERAFAQLQQARS